MTYTVFTPDEFRKELNNLSSTGNAIPDKQEITFNGGLLLSGKQTLDYGQSLNQTLINIAANFSSEEGPTAGEPDPLLIPNPLIGQTWYDRTNSIMKIWDGSNWTSLPVNISSSSVIVSPSINGNSNLQDVLEDLDNRIDAHIADSTDAHDASAISFSSYLTITSNNVQAAIQELKDELDTVESSADSSSHINDGTDAHDASAISFNPYLTITSSNVQFAMGELKDELDVVDSTATSASNSISNHIADGTDAHDASAISFSSYSTITSNNVQAAIQELKDELDNSGGSGMSFWRFGIDGTGFDQITNSDVLNFVSGSGINISRTAVDEMTISSVSEGGSFNQTGYIVNGNGFILQWGNVNIVAGGTVDVSFPIVFPNSGLNGLAVFNTSTGVDGKNLNVLNVTQNKIRIRNNLANLSHNVWWLAIGH